jgi:hypothetical protein
MINAVITFCFCFMGLTQIGFAAASLSVDPVDGSNRLRFERIPDAGIDNKKEIHIRVNSTGDRYQVFQRVLEPIINEKGEPLNLQAIGTQTLPNSNSYGTLYLQNSDHLSTGDQLLYSSSQNGTSDTFIIGYVLDRNMVNTSGSFRGRLIFTLRGMSNSSSDQITIDIFLDATSNLKISVKGAHNPAGIRIPSADTSEQAADFVNVSFSGNSGRDIRIYQEVETMPQDEMDHELPADVLQLDAQGNTDGLRTGGLNSLGPSRSLIYSSNKDEDSFLIYFLLNAEKAQQQEAGTYQGKIKYIVETDQGSQEFPINVQCVITPVFTMNVTLPPGGVKFPRVLANNPPQEQEVLVTVLSNLHKPYQVLQDLQTNMTNRKGEVFDSKYLTLHVEIPQGQRGQTNFVEFSPVQTGEYPIYSSDSSGSGATFKVLYHLQGYNQMNPGDFLAPVRFSLDQK